VKVIATVAIGEHTDHQAIIQKCALFKRRLRDDDPTTTDEMVAFLDMTYTFMRSIAAGGERVPSTTDVEPTEDLVEEGSEEYKRIVLDAVDKAGINIGARVTHTEHPDRGIGVVRAYHDGRFAVTWEWHKPSWPLVSKLKEYTS
jgi:hypothetical protein